jgi:cytochrome oxidase Cu insertion factor (SCO1/SenC/PrrC family)
VRKLFPLLSVALCLTLVTPSYGATTPPLTGRAAKAGGTILDVPIPAEILSIPLTDSHGKNFTLASLKGKTVILTDFLTLCNEICPMTSINMREIGDAISRAKFAGSMISLELTVDPKRDTPARLKSYQALFNDPSWTVATGAVKGVSALWSWFGAYTQVVAAEKGVTDWMTGKQISYDVNHSDVIVIIGPNLHWRWLDLGSPAVSNPKAKNTVPSKLYTYLSSNGKSNLVKPEQPFWTTSAVYGALNEIFQIKLGK